MTIKVTSAVQLSSVQQSTIEKALSSKYKGETLVFTYVVDAKVLGGIKLTIGSKELDGTLQAKVQQIRTSLTQNI